MIRRALNLVSKSVDSALSLVDPRRTVAYVGGWLGKENLGDEALLDAYRRLFPEVRFLHFDGGIVSRSRVRWPRMAGGILGGGTLIGQRRSWLHLAKDYESSGRPLAVFGTGVEEPRFWTGDTTVEDWAPLLRRCPFVGVRGPISASMLASAGVRNIEIVGDPVLAFARDAIATQFEPRTVGLNLGTSDGKVWGDERRIASEFCAVASLARAAGWIVHWFVVWPEDLPLTRAIATSSGTATNIHTLYSEPEAFIQRVGQLSVFAGMKLHATVLATCALTPSVMIEYRSKCRDYMQSINQDRHTLRSDLFTAHELWETLCSWDADRRGVAQELAKCVWSARDRQRQFSRELSLLKS